MLQTTGADGYVQINKPTLMNTCRRFLTQKMIYWLFLLIKHHLNLNMFINFSWVPHHIRLEKHRDKNDFSVGFLDK